LIDHSEIYQSRSLWHWHHRRRLKLVLDVTSGNLRAAKSYADIGCSNGYITNLVAQRIGSETTYGFDHSEALLESGRQLYPDISFHSVNLNEIAIWPRRFDLVTCFETLEHVGNLRTAICNLVSCVNPGGMLIVSVPVEIGFWGITKFFVKSLRGYDLNELPGSPSRFRYLRALVANARMSTFRDERAGWGTHFGFDFRDVDEILVECGVSAPQVIEKAGNRVICITC
jgi:SAM-dependent methyltransferase